MNKFREKVVPFLKQDEKILLYPTEGSSFSIFEFVNKHRDSLSVVEQKNIKSQQGLLPKKVPDFLTKPLTSNPGLKSAGGTIKTRSIGIGS